MGSNFIRVGMKLDIMVEPSGNDEKDNAREIYSSQILDVFSNGDLEIAMPVHQRRLVLLSNSMRYQIIFNSENGYYSAIGVVIDRYKSGNRYLVRMELKTQPERFQRREFFRCQCLVDVNYHELAKEELDNEPVDIILERYELVEMKDQMTAGIILDISGGGMRIVSKRQNTVGSIIRFEFELPIRGEMKVFNVAGAILSCELQQDSKLKYECRIKFVYIKPADREDIIRYIFEKERQSRKLSRG